MKTVLIVVVRYVAHGDVYRAQLATLMNAALSVER